jgi:hypothetical protein
MEFPLTLDDFLPIEKGASKSKTCKFKNTSLYVKISHEPSGEYFVELIPDDKSFEDIAVGHNGNVYDIWIGALQVLDRRLQD